MDLSAQEVNLFVPHLPEVFRIVHLPSSAALSETRMDIWIAGAVALLVAWVALVLTTEAAGWVHLLLTGGVFLLIWRIVARGTPSGPRPSTPGTPKHNKK